MILIEAFTKMDPPKPFVRPSKDSAGNHLKIGDTVNYPAAGGITGTGILVTNTNRRKPRLWQIQSEDGNAMFWFKAKQLTKVDLDDEPRKPTQNKSGNKHIIQQSVSHLKSIYVDFEGKMAYYYISSLKSFDTDLLKLQAIASSRNWQLKIYKPTDPERNGFTDRQMMIGEYPIAEMPLRSSAQPVNRKTPVSSPRGGVK